MTDFPARGKGLSALPHYNCFMLLVPIISKGRFKRVFGKNISSAEFWSDVLANWSQAFDFPLKLDRLM